MIKSTQQKQLRDEDFDFITALTRPQIETLIKQDAIQQSLFDETLHEIVFDDARYLLKRNPVRAEEIKASRYSKLLRLKQMITERNTYLQEHSKVKTASSFKRTESRVKRLKIDSWTKLTVDEEKRTIGVAVDEEKLKGVSRLNGCYCLTTSLSTGTLSKEDVHSRYKDLAMVENAFRTCKIGHLELRPIYVQKSRRTRANVFVVMLSHLLVRELQEYWRGVDRTVEENLNDLSSLCAVRVRCKGADEIYTIPRPRAELQRLFDLCGIAPPVILPAGQSRADTNQKLPCRRKSK